MACSELVTFRGGFVADWLVVQRLLDLEQRGCTFALVGDERFRVSPAGILTEDDRAFLRQRRDEARAIVEYWHRLDVPA